MKRIISILLLSLLIISGANAQKVYVIPIESEIDLGLFHHFRKACANAADWDADLLLIKLNTYGGAVDAADSIRTALLRTSIPTVAFVDQNAASAGALIALACDSVYMAPGSSMGSATVVNGAGEPMPQKYQSYMSTIMRSTAEHHGKVLRGDSLVWRRNPATAAEMVNPEMSVSFTPKQAVEAGFADGIATSTAEVLKDLNIENPEIMSYESSVTDSILGFLSSAAVRAVLVMLILGGIYMEMHTPGLGVAAAVAIIAAVLYFLPMLVMGSLPSWVLICFLIGVILIVLEIFVIPGFGICGISGITAIIVAIVGAMVHSDSITGVDFSGIVNAILITGVGILLAVGVVAWLTSSKGPVAVRRHSELMTELRNSDGFVGVDMEPAALIGKWGRAVTVLRPSGKVLVDDKVYDAVSVGDFINPGSKVKIIKYENAQIYVVNHDDESYS